MTLGVTGKLILAFVTLLLGAVLVNVVAIQGNTVTETFPAAEETHSFTVGSSGTADTPNMTVEHIVTAEPPTGWKVTDCPLTNFILRNATNASSGTILTSGTDYRFWANYGNWSYLNTTATQDLLGEDNNTYVQYYYCPDEYMSLGWGRTMINLIGGFFAIAVLMVSVGLFYSVGKETGLW